jgi:glutathione-regulated potassium-efflux system ancillary protein KefG
MEGAVRVLSSASSGNGGVSIAMRQVLIIFAHPAIERSRVNRQLIQAAGGLEGVRIHDLYEAYPDFDIDVSHEQRLFEAHDVVVFQHPFFWYSAPAILKQWQDLVLEHGWAYGRAGTALRGKLTLNAITAGGGEDSYRRETGNSFTVGEFLAPFEATARLCGMVWLPPFVVHGTHRLGEAEIAAHAGDYRRTLIALRDGTLDLAVARGRARLNSDLAAVLGS